MKKSSPNAYPEGCADFTVDKNHAEKTGDPPGQTHQERNTQKIPPQETPQKDPQNVNPHRFFCSSGKEQHQGNHIRQA